MRELSNMPIVSKIVKIKVLFTNTFHHIQAMMIFWIWLVFQTITLKFVNSLFHKLVTMPPY